MQSEGGPKTNQVVGLDRHQQALLGDVMRLAPHQTDLQGGLASAGQEDGQAHQKAQAADAQQGGGGHE